jgi:prolyl-tRNA synthetase
MRQSELFTKTRREAPKDEVSKNAELLIRAGFIHKEMAGIYSYLPLGLRVRDKIVEIVRDEMNKIKGQEVFLTALQEKTLWEKTNRWDNAKVDIWFKTKLKNETEVGLGFTHEEPLTVIMKDHIQSYRDLPKYVYQFQTKFRNEFRSKNGLIRGKEFLMKDLYSFSAKEEGDEGRAKFYEYVKEAYIKIFNRVGIADKTYFTRGSGGIFTEYSNEFQTLTEAGEDIIYIDKDNKNNKNAVNKEVWDEYKRLDKNQIREVGLSIESAVERKAVEVGNIFNLGTRFSEALGLYFTDENGNSKPVLMGCYGIGIGRLMGTVVEVFADDKGIIWPESVSPFKIHLVSLSGDDKVKMAADKLYEKLNQKGIEVLYDDRDLRAGEKFQDSDLIGLPYRVIISDKTLESGRLEMKIRATGETKMVGEEELYGKN